MKKKKDIKICFAASSGGHYEQLMMLKPLMNKYDSFVITEETTYADKRKKGISDFFERKTRYHNLYRSVGDDSDLSRFKNSREKIDLYRIFCKSDQCDFNRKTAL